MNDTLVKNDLRTMSHGLLVDLLEAGFNKEQIEVMPEPQWSLLIAQHGLNSDEVEAFRNLYSESAYEQFVIAKSAGIPETDLLQYIRTDLPLLMASKGYWCQPIEDYVVLRTSQYGLSHREALEVVAALGGNPDGRRLYLTLRKTGCSHTETMTMAVFTFVQDLLVRGDAIRLDVQNNIKVSRLSEILTMPAGAQVSLCKAIEFYNQE